MALAQTLMHGGDYGEAMRRWYRRYPNSGYGGMFRQWARSDNAGPYNSWGTGAAMRVSPVGFAFDDLERVLAKAQASAEPTHNHLEGIKGAQAAVAAILWPARAKTKPPYVVNSKPGTDAKTESAKSLLAADARLPMSRQSSAYFGQRCIGTPRVIQ